MRPENIKLGISCISGTKKTIKILFRSEHYITASVHQQINLHNKRKKKKNLVNQFCKVYKNLPPEQVVPYQLNDSHKLPQINNDLIYVIQVKNKAFEMIWMTVTNPI